MQNNIFLGDVKSQYSEYHKYHDSLENVYKTFINFKVYQTLFEKDFQSISLKRDTNLDDEGNEISFITHSNKRITFRVENYLKHKTHIQFCFRCIYQPITCSPFLITFHFYWDTITEITIFQIEVFIEDERGMDDLIKRMKQSILKTFKGLEKYLQKTIKNLDQVESIIIKNSINKVWEYISSLDNLKCFFPLKNMTAEYEGKNIIKVVDGSTKNTIKLKRTESFFEGRDKRILILELFESSVPMPKQIIEITSLELCNIVTFFILKHTILEYIPYDALRSNSRQKQKILKKIKKELESAGSVLTGGSSNNNDNNKE